MTSPMANATADVDCQVATEAWVQSNRDAFVWTKLPLATTRSRREGASGVTTYKLPMLAQFMLSVVGLMPWRVGDEPPPAAEIGEATVTITIDDRATPNSQPLPLGVGSAHRLAEIQNDFVPGELSLLFQGIEKRMVEQLQSAAFTSKTWSGTGTLQANSSNDHTPLADLRVALLPYLKYKSNARYKLVMILDQRVLSVLTGYTDFHGAGVGSATQSGVTPEAVIGHIKQLLGVQEIYVVTTATESVADGHPSSLTDLGGGILWCGLIDARPPRDMRTYDHKGPDGAIAVAISREPEVVNWEDKGSEVERFHGRTEFDVFTPRATAYSDVKFGFYYPSSENLS